MRVYVVCNRPRTTEQPGQTHTYFNLSDFMGRVGLKAWHPYILRHTKIRTPSQLRMLTAQDLRELGRAANWRLESGTIDQVLQAIRRGSTHTKSASLTGGTAPQSASDSAHADARPRLVLRKRSIEKCSVAAIDQDDDDDDDKPIKLRKRSHQNL